MQYNTLPALFRARFSNFLFIKKNTKRWKLPRPTAFLIGHNRTNCKSSCEDRHMKMLSLYNLIWRIRFKNLVWESDSKGRCVEQMRFQLFVSFVFFARSLAFSFLKTSVVFIFDFIVCSSSNRLHFHQHFPTWYLRPLAQIAIFCVSQYLPSLFVLHFLTITLESTQKKVLPKKWLLFLFLSLPKSAPYSQLNNVKTIKSKSDLSIFIFLNNHFCWNQNFSLFVSCTNFWAIYPTPPWYRWQ